MVQGLSFPLYQLSLERITLGFRLACAFRGLAMNSGRNPPLLLALGLDGRLLLTVRLLHLRFGFAFVAFAVLRFRLALGLVVLAALGGYLLGSIPFGLVLTRLAGTEDLRSIGSGSIGATHS